MVDGSPWPIVAGIVALLLTLGLVFWIHIKTFFYVGCSLALIVILVYSWWKDVVRESCYLSFHGVMVQNSLRIGILLFIVSEVFFFLSFFWAFFHSSLSVLVDISEEWPPISLEPMNPIGVPLLNTVVLLSSSVSVTYSHYSVLTDDYESGFFSLVLTLGLSFFFTLLQLMEYIDASFTIADSVYGSVFFIATSFHGFHVIVGSLFLGVCLFRIGIGHFTGSHHVSLECAIWYWHFVDVVWIFLYVSIYWWGSV